MGRRIHRYMPMYICIRVCTYTIHLYVCHSILLARQVLQALSVFPFRMQREVPLEFHSLGPPGIGWAPSADGSWPTCWQAGCHRRLPPFASWAGRCSICARLELLRAECSEVSGGSPQVRTVEQLLDICIRLAAEGTLDQAIESGTVAAYPTARQP